MDFAISIENSTTALVRNAASMGVCVGVADVHREPLFLSRICGAWAGMGCLHKSVARSTFFPFYY